MIGGDMIDGPNETCFTAELRPNCSSSARAVNILGAVLLVIFVSVGLVFMALGAWPVFGFMGLEVFLLYGGLRLHRRLISAYETISLTRRDLWVERIGPWGRRQRWRLPRYWLQVRHRKAPNRGGYLELRSHGRCLSVGGFLTADERDEVAESLRRALTNAYAPPPMTA